MVSLASRLLRVLGAFCCVSCISAEFSTLRVDQPLSESVLARVEVGDSLQTCLDSLGAPHGVYRDDEGTRTILTWQWLEAGGWGVSLSVPVTDRNSASVDYASDSQIPQQVQLFFDSNWKVVEISRERNG